MSDINNEAISDVIQENIKIRDNIANAYSAIYNKDPSVVVPENGALDDNNLPGTISNIKTFKNGLDGNDGPKIFAERGVLENNNTDLNSSTINANNGIYFLKKGETYSNIPDEIKDTNGALKDDVMLKVIVNSETKEVYQQLFFGKGQIFSRRRIKKDDSSWEWIGWEVEFMRFKYAHQAHMDEYNDDTPFEGVYIDEAIDPKTCYLIKNNSEKVIGILFCATFLNKTTQFALYYSGPKIRKKHLENWGEWMIIETQDNKDPYDQNDSYYGISYEISKYPSSRSVREILERINGDIEDIDSKKVTSLSHPSDETYPTTKAVSDALDTKVDNITGKGLSTNDFTNAYKNKLDGIEAEANRTIVDSELSSISEYPVQNKIIQKALKIKEDEGNKDKYDFDDKDYRGISDDDTHYPSSLAVRVALYDREDKKNKDEYDSGDKKYKGISDNDSKYPSSKAVREIFDTKVNIITGKSLVDDNLITKLEGIEIDSELSNTSEHLVQNKVIQQALDKLEKKSFVSQDLLLTDNDLNHAVQEGNYFLLANPSTPYINSPLENEAGLLEVFQTPHSYREGYGYLRCILTQRIITKESIYIRDSSMYRASEGPSNNIFSNHNWEKINLKIDDTLTQPNQPADAKTVGEALVTKENISNKATSLDNPSDETYPTTKVVSNALSTIIDNSLSQSGQAADAKTVGDDIYGEMNDNTIRPYISSACPKTYHFFSQLYGSPLNIHNIKDMGYNTVVWVNVSSNNIDNVKDFISYVKNGVTVYPINISLNNQYMISKYHIYDRIVNDIHLDANIYTIHNLTTNEIVHGYLYYTGDNTAYINWFNNTDKTLLDNIAPSNSKTVGDTIFRETNDENTRRFVRNNGLLKYLYSSASQAIADLHSINVDSPYDMVNGSYVTLVESTNNPNMSTFLGTNFMPTGGIYNSAYYTLEKHHLYSNSSMFILSNAKGEQIFYGVGQPDSEATPPYKITWGDDIGSVSLNAKINTLIYANREDITPLPFATYNPTSTPFDPWKMPENTVYFGAPSMWYENSEHVPYITLDRSNFEKANSTTDTKELVSTTYQLIKYRKSLQIICPYNKQFFFGGKTVVNGTPLERWATNSVQNNVQYTVYNTEINRNGNVTINPDITTDTNNFLASTNDPDDDRTIAIEGMLASGCCILGCGDFYISDLVMPDNTCLRGCGNKTRLIWSKANGSTCMIQMGHNCNIENLRIDAEGETTSPFDWGEVKPTDEKDIPNFSAILYQNHAATGIADLNQSKISNVSIFNCNGIGIKTTSSTLRVDRNLIVINCHIRDCICGIYNEAYLKKENVYNEEKQEYEEQIISITSEFHKFTNVVITHSFYGCVVQGGNIIYNNCTFGACHIAIKLDSGPNNSHGIFNACLFVHCANNQGGGTHDYDAGYALKANGITNGELFNGCNFGFGKIEIQNCTGIKFMACSIGKSKISIDENSEGTIFNGCTLGRDTVNYTNNSTATRIINCFTREGEEWQP